MTTFYTGWHLILARSAHFSCNSCSYKDHMTVDTQYLVSVVPYQRRAEGWFLAAELHLTLLPWVLHLTLQTNLS